MSLETRLKCAVNVRPITITNLVGTGKSCPHSFSCIIEAATPTQRVAALLIGCTEKTITAASRLVH